MKSLTFVVILFSLFWANEMKAQIVYETQYQTTANIIVYVTDIPTIADLIVYKAPFQIYPGINKNEGIWYFTSYQKIANKIIYFAQYQTIADLIICYTDIPTIAG